MNVEAAAVALNLLALVAACAYALAQIMGRNVSPVDQRLAALFVVLMVLMGVRAARTWFHLQALRHVEEAVAAFVPLYALFLAEGLQRRHAPSWMKYAIALGSIVFALAALMRPISMAGDFAYALGAFVSLALLSLALMLGLRQRALLAQSENDAINAAFVGLVIALPLAVTDFLAAGGVPLIRAGGLGLLVFMLAVARVTAIGGGGFAVLVEIFWTAIAALLSLVLYCFVFGTPSWPEAVNIAALIWAVVLTFRIIQYPVEQNAARARSSLWQAFAEAPITNFDVFMDRMLGAPELRRAYVVEGQRLAGYDTAKLLLAFAEAPVLGAVAARADEQLSVLMDENEATHVILLASAPPRLLFVTLPRVGAGGDVEAQLHLLAKLAQQAAHA